MKKGTITRIIVNSVLLAAIVALGITLFQSKPQTAKDSVPEAENTEEIAQAEEDPSIDAGTNDVQANLEETESTEDESDTTAAEDESSSETQENDSTVSEDSEEPAEEETQSTSASVLPQVDFTESTLMQWPVEGELMMDYSMENTTYFSTLDQYKLNPAIVVKAVVGAPVKAAANGTVTAIEDKAQTGTTLTMDMGNGYQAVYGQLNDLLVEEGQTVKEGTILGYISDPSKYYSIEGSSLYFAMTKDGQPIDPITYLP